MAAWYDDTLRWPTGMVERLAGAVRRVSVLPPTEFALEAAVGAPLLSAARELLDAAVRHGFGPSQFAVLLDAIAAARTAEARRHRVDLVWSQPEDAASRDTDAVIAELAGEAEHELLLSTMSIGHYGGTNPALEPIAKRLVDVPSLLVRLFVNVPPKARDGTPHRDPKARFLRDMKRYWPPGPPLPQLWFAPMSLAGDDAGILHAKCVVADRRRAFVTSANLTDAAQWKNIEAGALIADAAFARSLAEHFDQLIARGVVERLA